MAFGRTASPLPALQRNQAYGLVLIVKQHSGILVLSVEDDKYVGRLHEPNDPEEGTHESKHPVDCNALLVDYARRHSVEHLEHEVGAVHKKQTASSKGLLTAWTVWVWVVWAFHGLSIKAQAHGNQVKEVFPPLYSHISTLPKSMDVAVGIDLLKFISLAQ